MKKQWEYIAQFLKDFQWTDIIDYMLYVDYEYVSYKEVIKIS